MIRVVTLDCCVVRTVLAVWVEATVTVLVEETNLIAKKHADVTILAGYLARTLGVDMARLLLPPTTDVMVVDVVLTENAVVVAPTLVTVTVCNVTDTGVVVVADVIVTTGVV